jgi:DNA-directed RNA polymerase specialized sigma24 family protein
MTGELIRSPVPPDVARLFKAHRAELIRLAVLLVRDQPTAEDVFQDVFARLMPGRSGSRAETAPCPMRARQC